METVRPWSIRKFSERMSPPGEPHVRSSMCPAPPVRGSCRTTLVWEIFKPSYSTCRPSHKSDRAWRKDLDGRRCPTCPDVVECLRAPAHQSALTSEQLLTPEWSQVASLTRFQLGLADKLTAEPCSRARGRSYWPSLGCLRPLRIAASKGQLAGGLRWKN